MNRTSKTLIFLTLCVAAASCSDESDPNAPGDGPISAVEAAFGNAIDLDNLPDYAIQSVPRYVRKNNAGSKPVTDAGATLGRVLFYDKALSVDNTVSCASCHRQEVAFSDTAKVSVGVAGETPRHSMRLVNVQYAEEVRLFWDERAVDLEDQTTQPIRDHLEMGFSGTDGNPDMADLLAKLADIGYYQELFAFVYGDPEVTEERLQNALSQFIRSIRSFDTKYDEGRLQAPDDRSPFANFTEQENQGKDLFMVPPQLDEYNRRLNGGLGCVGCHRPPEFDIDPEAMNNGVIRTAAGVGIDLNVTRAPTLRNVVRADGTANGGLMHTGDFDLDTVLDHYNLVPEDGNTNLDPRLNPQGVTMRLQMTVEEREAVKAFLRTLAGTEIYTDPKWSDPFPSP
jgi:cytochrome c peroxidase